MAKYEAKNLTGRTSIKGYHFVWRKATQEELAFAYEELGLIEFVNKLNNEETTNKKTKKSSKTKKGKK